MTAAKTLAKNYSGNEQVVKEMKNVCSRLSAQAVLDSFKEEPVVGAGIICLSEILQCLGMHGVGHLKVIVPWILDLMRGTMIRNLVILNSLIVSIQKLMQKF